MKTYEETLAELAHQIEMGYGWVEEDMLLLYSEDLNIPWEVTKKYFDENFPTIEIQTMKGWNLCSTLKQIEKDLL